MTQGADATFGKALKTCTCIQSMKFYQWETLTQHQYVTSGSLAQR